MVFRSEHFFIFSQLLILSDSLVFTHAQYWNDSCTNNVIVKRNSKAEALSADSLKINCTLTYCDEKPTVGWCKVSELDDECTPVSETDLMEILWTGKEEKTGISSLHFKHIAMTDSGLYRCRCEGESGGCVSHSINVTVKEKMLDIEHNVSNDNHTTNASQHETPDTSEWFWPAIYISSGVTSAIIITALFCVGHRFCRGSQQAWTNKANKNQYSSVQMSDIGASLPDSHHPVQGRSHPSSQATPATVQSQVECVYENGSGVRSRPISNVSSGDVVPLHGHSANHAVTPHRTVEEEVSPLVYASLNHHVTTRPHTRPIKVNEESTEYAAIRLS